MPNIKIKPDAEALDIYDRAYAIEGRLRALGAMIDAQVTHPRRGDSFCHGCYWTTILKPLLTDVIGDGRGKTYAAPEDVEDEEDVDLGAVMLAMDDAERRRPASPPGSREEWLRSPEVWEAVTWVLLWELYRADPGNGCGFKRVRHEIEAA